MCGPFGGNTETLKTLYVQGFSSSSRFIGPHTVVIARMITCMYICGECSTRQAMLCNVTVRRVRATIVAVAK